MDLKPGDIICPDCKGTGYDLKINDYPFGYKMHPHCDKCNGEGKLDWIEAVVGKRNSIYEPWFAPHGIRRGQINEIKTR